MIRVSIIMPCYNHGSFVAESIASVLRQTHAALELIVVDDGSRDASRRIVRDLAAADPRIRVLLHPQNRGASRSRNDGIEAATGDVIGFCDADDLWLPEKLAVQLEELSRHPEADVVYSDASIIDETGRPVGRLFSDLYRPPDPPSGSLFRHLCLRNFINLQTGMIRRRCLESGIRFDPRIRWVEDWQFWLELSRNHAFRYTPYPLARYRVHRNSSGVVHARANELNRARIYTRLLQREPQLPRSLVAQVLYHTGCCLLNARRPRLARRLFRRSIATALGSVASAAQCVRPLARLVSA